MWIKLTMRVSFMTVIIVTFFFMIIVVTMIIMTILFMLIIMSVIVMIIFFLSMIIVIIVVILFMPMFVITFKNLYFSIFKFCSGLTDTAVTDTMIAQAIQATSGMINLFMNCISPFFCLYYMRSHNSQLLEQAN